MSFSVSTQSDEQGRDGYYIPREQYFHTELDLTQDEAAVLVMLANSAKAGNDAISSNTLPTRVFGWMRCVWVRK